MYIKIKNKINNNKFSNIVQQNDTYYIFGINSEKINQELNKFIIFYEKYSLDFKFIEKIIINYNFDKSTLIWDILEINDYYIFLIEQKSIDSITHQCKFYKYYIKKENIDNFVVDKIEQIDLENYLISTLFNNHIIASKIEIDEERPDYFWGKYLFHFQNENNEFYRPTFDSIVNYTKDKGHILHYIEEDKNINEYKWYFDNDGNCVHKKYFIIFSIRHKYDDNPTKYYYKIYSAHSDDLKYFYDTKEITIENNITDSKWYCYPEVFKKDNKYYVLLNQDDFGKEKESLLGELCIDYTE